MKIFDKILFGKQEPLAKLYKEFGRIQVQNAFERAAASLCKRYILNEKQISNELYSLIEEEFEEFISYFSKELNTEIKLSVETCQSMITISSLEKIKQLYSKEENEFT